MKIPYTTLYYVKIDTERENSNNGLTGIIKLRRIRTTRHVKNVFIEQH